MAIRTLCSDSVRFDIFKWLYLAHYWAYLHQTWGFCKAWSIEFVDRPVPKMLDIFACEMSA